MELESWTRLYNLETPKKALNFALSELPESAMGYRQFIPEGSGLVYEFHVIDDVYFRVHPEKAVFLCPGCNKKIPRRYEFMVSTRENGKLSGLGRNCLLEKVLGLVRDEQELNNIEEEAREYDFTERHKRKYGTARTPEDYLRSLDLNFLVDGYKSGFPPLSKAAKNLIAKILEGNPINSNNDLSTLSKAEAQAREEHNYASQVLKAEIEAQEKQEAEAIRTLKDNEINFEQNKKARWAKYLQDNKITLAEINWELVDWYLPAGEKEIGWELKKKISEQTELDIGELKILQRAVSKAHEFGFSDNNEQ
jgi:hypothetical protein